MPDQLTTARDQIAEMCGFHKHPNLGWGRDTTTISDDCPIPACLNFVSRVWPERWDWVRDVNEDGAYRWVSFGTHAGIVSISTMDSDELTDRMTLLLKVLHWLRDNDRPAFGAACEKIRKECGQ